MPDEVKISVHVPAHLGLTDEQIKLLKDKVRVDIVASVTPKTEHQIVIEVVDHHPPVT